MTPSGNQLYSKPEMPYATSTHNPRIFTRIFSPTKTLFFREKEFTSSSHAIVSGRRGGLMVSALVSESGFEPWPGDIVLCSWARHLTLTVPLFTQVYKWAPASLMLGVALGSPIQGGVEILPVATCHRDGR